MKIIKKYVAVITILACIMNLIVIPVFAETEDTEGWRDTLTISNPIYDTAVTISLNIKKTADVSYAIQFMTTNDEGATKAFASIRLSAAGKLLFRDNSGWISAANENTESYIRADFAANVDYSLKMKFTIETGEIEWYLNDESIGTSTTTITGHPCEHIRLMSTQANMDYLDWSLESVVTENEDAEVLKTFSIDNLMYDTAVTISLNIKKTADVSYAIQFMTTNDNEVAKTIASIRLSATGKLLFKDDGTWISVSEEKTEDYIKADFAANVEYNLKMKFAINSGLIEWFLDDKKIGESTTNLTGNPCDQIGLMTTEENKDYLELSIESVVAENANAEVLSTNSPAYSNVQGKDNWYYCEYGLEEIRNLTFSSDEAQWKGDENYPYISILNKDITPADELAVGFTFVAPETGMVRLKGEVSLPYEESASADITASIYKGRKEIWSEGVTYSDSASYYYTIPLQKGEELHFKINSNGSNSCDWAHWTPTVEYLDINYVPEDEVYTFYQKQGDILKKLEYDEDLGGYLADDGDAFISHTAIRPSLDYAVVKSYTVQTEGRHRVYGEFGATDADMTVTVLKNSDVIWEQLLPEGETGVLDVRMLASVGDVIDIEARACENTPSKCTVNDLYIEYHVGTAFCKASTSVGYSYNTLEEFNLGELVTNPGETKVEFYSRRFSRKLPMTYDEGNSKWVSSIDGDIGYFTSEAAYPGKHYESVMEITVPKSGILRIDGDMSVRDISDGVVSKISLNDEIIWSSRIGGERPVRWDEPFDVSYFLNNAGVVARVEEGDKLAFSFNQWRLVNNDKVDISNVVLKYISGDVLSDTTKWKLDNSIVVDTQKQTVQIDGVSDSVDVITKGGITYIAKADLSKVFGSGFVTSETSVSLYNKDYLPLRNVAENEGKSVVWAADKLVIIYDTIPVLFGWNELSEVNVAYSSALPEFIYGCFDTYESGETPSISLTGSNSDPSFNSLGGLKPPNGFATIAEQSNAVVLEYAGNENISSNTSRIKISDYVEEEKANMVSFDMFIPSACDFEFSVLDDEGAEGMQFLVSSNGWIGPCYGRDTNTPESIEPWMNRSLSDVLSNSSFTGAEFEFGKWNNIKLICDIPNRQYHLYLNDKLIQTIKKTNLESQSWEWSTLSLESLQITNYSAKNGVKTPLYLDNLTVGTADYFIAKSELTETSLSAMNITLSDTFEEDDSLDVLLAWTGDNQFRPLGGDARILKQSNAARVFSGISGENTEHIRFDVSEYVGDGSLPVVIDFDISLFSDEIFVFSDRKYWGYGQQAVVSPNGYIAATYGKWIDNDDQYAAIRVIANRTRNTQTALTVDTADFELNTWHNIKMLYEDGGKKRSLYVDGDLVCVWTKDTESPLEAFQISTLGNANTEAGNALFDIDNLKIAQLNRFVISELYSENQTGKIENFVPGETCYVRFSAENNNDFEESVQLVIAQYDSSNMLIDILMPEKFSLKEDGGVVNIGYDSKDTISFKALDNAEKIMIAAWDGNNELRPLVKAASIFRQTVEEND